MLALLVAKCTVIIVSYFSPFYMYFYLVTFILDYIILSQNILNLDPFKKPMEILTQKGQTAKHYCLKDINATTSGG